MHTFSDFTRELAGIQQDVGLDETEKSRRALHTIARYFYFRTEGVPNDHVSAFHVWWEKHAAEVLGLTVDDEQCRLVAEVLERHFSRASLAASHFPPPPGTDPQAIANCRFFSAAQDFGGRFRRSPFELLAQDAEYFSPAHLLANPERVDGFLRHTGAEAQYDKRRDYVRNGAEWLQANYGGEAFNLHEANGRSVRKLSKAMTVKTVGMGFSAKKTHMFVRDLFDWGVWDPAIDIHELDVASDANTMRIALRTGVVRLKIPTLLPSYLDIHSPQYELVDDANVRAWRRVWEVWGELPDNHRVPAPAFFDFFIYTLGKTTCRKTTPRCKATSRCSKLGQDDCPAAGSDVCDGYCPLRNVCPEETRILQPPKSISIFGRTGWGSGSTNEGGGLGITA